MKNMQKTLLTAGSENRAGAGFFCCGCGLNSGRSKWFPVVPNSATPTGMIFAPKGTTWTTEPSKVTETHRLSVCPGSGALCHSTLRYDSALLELIKFFHKLDLPPGASFIRSRMHTACVECSWS